MNAEQLIAFEADIAAAFERGEIKSPVHLSGGNESQLIEIFKNISRQDYVFSTWRNHYHALLHGIPEEWVRAEIMAGHSMNLMNHEHRFFTSAIVGGILPIALGVAAALKRRKKDEYAIAFHSDGTQTNLADEKVWCFVGDMTATTGIFYEAQRYASGHDLPIMFIVEDNGLSTNTPTQECWSKEQIIRRAAGAPMRTQDKVIRYWYERTYPHYGVAKNAAI